MKYKSLIFKMLAAIGAILLLLLFLMIAFSPYGRKEGFVQKLVFEKIVIEADAEAVFRYLGNSENAEDWSVFVDHIKPLNAQKFADGQVGSVRRCFTEKDETGEIWDEEILLLKTNELRLLSCYHFQNFSLSTDQLRTEQRCHSMGNGATQLTFTLFFPSDDTSLLDAMKMYFAAYYISSIFKGNLLNIKRLVEEKEREIRT